jgi:hypothetical protein
MSQIIAYKLQIDNLKQTIADMKQLKQLIQDVNTSGGINKLTPRQTTSTGPGAPTTIRNKPSTLEDIALASVATNQLRNSGSTAKIQQSFAELFARMTPAQANLYNNPGLTEKGKRRLLEQIAKPKPFSYDTTKSFEENQQIHAEGFQNKFNAPSPYSGPVPPVLNKNFRDIMLSGFTKLLETAVKVVSKLGIFGILLSTAALELRTFVKVIKEGIKVGSEAYRNAAGQGTKIGNNAQISTAFGQLGLPAPDMTYLRQILSGNTNQDSQIILALAQMGQLGQAGQQLVNMSTEFKNAMQDGAQDAREMAESSKAAMQLSIDSTAIAREWHTMVAQTTDLFEPILHVLFQGFVVILKDINLLIELLKEGLHELFGFHFDTDKFQAVLPGGQGGSLIAPTTGLEKLGFVLGVAHSPAVTLEKIANNTAKQVTLLTKLTNDQFSPKNLQLQGKWAHQALPGLP